MILPAKVKAQVIARFDDLIAEGKSFVESIGVFPAGQYSDGYYGFDRYDWDSQRHARWKTSCVTLLQPFIRRGTHAKEQVDVFQNAGGKKPEVEYCLGMLEAFRDDFEKGFLDDLLLKIEAEIAGDYLGQAEGLLKEGQRGQYDHIPAAVLTGAVLVKALRTLCDQQDPPVPTVTPKDEPKTMNPLIEDLKKAGLFNELKAKQLRSWADIRNKAAHGEFDQFTKADVEQMMAGVQNFLADYLG